MSGYSPFVYSLLPYGSLGWSKKKIKNKKMWEKKRSGIRVWKVR